MAARLITLNASDDGNCRTSKAVRFFGRNESAKLTSHGVFAREHIRQRIQIARFDEAKSHQHVRGIRQITIGFDDCINRSIDRSIVDQLAIIEAIERRIRRMQSVFLESMRSV